MSYSVKKKLFTKLEQHHKYFDRSKISPDPLEFPHKFTNPVDIEISAFLSATFAYGNIRQIMNTLNKLHSIMEWQPNKFLINYKHVRSKNIFKDFKHRFFSSSDIERLFLGLHKIYKSGNSIKKIFLSGYNENHNLKKTISVFSQNMITLVGATKDVSHGIKFMFPDPEKGSACKRTNLFLRWMVRNDELDFGLWNEIPTSVLIIPVDVHVARICRQLKLTSLKNVSWKMAEEITGNLRKFDPIDPVKYDFAICHIGMRKMIF